jgi:hypothetical protein
VAHAAHALPASKRRPPALAPDADNYAIPPRRFEPRTLEEALMSGRW